LKIIHYASLIEGYLDEYLVKEILKGIATGLNSDVVLNRHSKLVQFKGGSKNKSKVLAGITNLSQTIALENRSFENPILFIAGIDSDKDDFQSLITEMETKIHQIAKESTIIFVAVRDVETWVEYLLKPDSMAGSLDKGNSKSHVYPDGKSNEANAKNVIRELRTRNSFHFDSLQHLCTQSPSFSHFHQQIITYLQNIS
jgi:hypothetical protein